MSMKTYTQEQRDLTLNGSPDPSINHYKGDWEGQRITDYLTSKDTSPEETRLLNLLKQWWLTDYPAFQKFSDKANESLNFYIGNQWKDDKEAALNPNLLVSLNKIKAKIDSVLGAMAANPQQAVYIPRKQGDATANQLLSSVAQWFRDEATASLQEQDAFLNCLTTGIGITDTTINFTLNPDGAPFMESISPLEMVIDSRASLPNFMDARRAFRIYRADGLTLSSLFPNTSPDQWNFPLYNPADHKEKDNPASFHDQQAANLGLNNQSKFFTEKQLSEEYTFIEARWLEEIPYYNLLFPDNSQYYTDNLEEAEFAQANLNASLIRLTKNITKRAFIGETFLQPVDTPLCPDGTLGWNFITAFINKTKDQTNIYGIVECMKEPQKVINRLYSQLLYIFSRGGKGSYFVEKNVFTDIVTAERKLNKAGQLIEVNSGKKDAITPVAAPQIPPFIMDAFTEANNAIDLISGISQEFQGMTDRDQPGILEQTRQKATMNLLGAVWNSFNEYLKAQGKTMLFLIQNCLADGRIVRITGLDTYEYVPLTSEQFTDQDYDIVIQTSDASMSNRDTIFAQLQQIVPQCMTMLANGVDPQIVVKLLQYSPLPPTLISDFTPLLLNTQTPSPQVQDSQLNNGNGGMNLPSPSPMNPQI